MVAFWAQFVDHLIYAARAGLSIIDRGVSSFTSPERPWIDASPLSQSVLLDLGRWFPSPLFHVVAATLVLVLSLTAFYLHATPSPQDAVLHDCGCAAQRRPDRPRS